FADDRVHVSPPIHIGSPTRYRSEVRGFSDRRSAIELWGIELVRVRCSAHRRPASKAGTLLARASPWYWPPHEDSNLDLRLRRPASCPFDYGASGAPHGFRSRFSAVRGR